MPGFPKVERPQKHEKGWGYELWIANSDKYCGKILHFNKSAKFSMHFHMDKDETWYVTSGEFIFRWIDTKTAEIHEQKLSEGDSVHILPGQPHQLETLTGGEIYEVSTTHYEHDSYRVMPGDSQKEKPVKVILDEDIL